MSSTSYGGSPSSMHRRGVHPNAASPPTPVAATSSPSHPLLTRNNQEVGGGGVGSHASPFQRHQPFIHDVSSSPNHRNNVVYLSDSDDDHPHVQAQPPPPPPPPPPRSVPLQPAFDLVPPTAQNGAGKIAHRASATPTIASLINTEPPPKKAKSSHPSPTSSGFFADTNGSKKITAAAAAAAAKKPDAPTNPDHSPKTKTCSSAPSPKPIRPAPTSSGSGGGLLGDVFQAGAAGKDDDQMPNIYIHVPLNGESNKYINFAKLAEDRYGWAALNPRLAKAKAHVDSGDEMMVDGGSESESNVEMGGTGDGGAGDDPKKRAKRRYQDVYDKEDPFIDDSEMLWEEQAAASKDGFFVYSGPLVPEGEKPQIERADGTVKRGRGRGRGSRGGAAATRGAGTTARKPRITKKEKEKLEKEKEERERFALQVAAQTKGIQPRP